MHRVVYKRGNYIVKKIRDGYYVYNKNRLSEDEHTHIYTKKTCRKLIDLIHKRRVPNSSYLRISVLRICKDEKLLRDVRHKIEKDRDKQQYCNAGGGKR